MLKFSCWISTLHLNKKGIILHPSIIFKFTPGERLRQNSFILIFRRNVLKQHYPSLHTISEMMVPDIYMLGPIMKHKINREFNATLIITTKHCLIHLRTKQTNQDLSHPDSLTCSLTCCHVFFFCWTECHGSLLPTVPGNYCRSNAKDPPWCALSIQLTASPICIHEAMQLPSIHPSVP